MFYIVITFGVVFLLSSLMSIYFGMVSKHWPTAVGRIKSVEVKQESMGKRKGSTEHYRPVVHYEYSVDGLLYKSTAISNHGHLQRTESEAQKVIAVFSPGSTAIVYYNPNNPSRSYLIKGSTGSAWLSALFGLGATAVGILGVVKDW